MAYNGRTDGQVTAQYKCRDCRAFQRDVKYLEHLLDKERARGRQQREWRLTLCQALDEAHEKLAKLQPPEESYSDVDKETWQPEKWEEEGDCNIETQQPEDCEEEDVWDEETWQPKNCPEDSKTLSTTKIATEATKQKQETDPNRYFKELQESHRINQERLALELQAEKSINEVLQDELEKVRASYTEISQRCEADNLRARQQAIQLKADLDKAVKSQMQTFQAEQDALHLQMMEEMTCLQKNAAEDKMLLQREVEELTQLNAQLSLKKERENKAHIINLQRFAVELQAEKSTTEALQDELEKVRVLYNDISQRCEADNLRARQQATHLKAELEEADKSQVQTDGQVRAEEEEEEKQEEKPVDKPADKTVPNNHQESPPDVLPASEPVETEASEETPQKKKKQRLGKKRRKKQKDAALNK